MGNKPRTGKVIVCRVCKKEFYVKPYGIIFAKYCSYQCKYKGTENKIRKACAVCSKIVERPASAFKWGKLRGHTSFYCSIKCASYGIALKRKGRIISKIWSMRQADRIFSDFIRNRDNWICRYCGKEFRKKTGQLHNSHFWSRRKWSTRFDPENCIALCFSCHKWKLETEKQGAYKELMLDWLGEDKYKLLEQRARASVQKYEVIKDLMKWIAPHLKTMKMPKKRSAFVVNKDGMSYLD